MQYRTNQDCHGQTIVQRRYISKVGKFDSTRVDAARSIPILDVAMELGIRVRGSKALCFENHDRNTPSLSFHKGWNTWKCFGACGQKGDTIALVMAFFKIPFLEAIEWLAQRFGIASGPPRSVDRETRRAFVRTSGGRAPLASMRECIPDSEVYEWLVSKCGAPRSPFAIRYLQDHGISVDTATRYGVRELLDVRRAEKQLIEAWGPYRLQQCGLFHSAPAGKLIWRHPCLVFPCFSGSRIVFLQARMSSGSQKFLSLRGIRTPLFNASTLSSLAPGSTVFVCEGIPDTLAILGRHANAVGVLGATAFRDEWAPLLLPFDVVLVPDGDAAGSLFCRSVSVSLAERGKTVRYLSVPNGMDASSVVATWG